MRKSAVAIVLVLPLALPVLAQRAASAKERGAANRELGADTAATLSWEKKVVGPRKNTVDHKKIEALQKQAAKDAERERERPKVVVQQDKKKVPYSETTLPTMEIEKPATRAPAKREAAKPKPAVVEERRPANSDLDNLLDSEARTSSSSRPQRSNGLAKLFGN